MRRFLKHFFLFLVPIIGLLFVADGFVSDNLKKSNHFVKGEFSTWNKLYEKNLNAEIIVLGSSRAWVHFDAAMMTDSLKASVYNIGMDGYNFWFQDYRLKLALQSNPKPKVVIHSVDVFTFAKRPDLFYPEQFLPYMLGNAELQQVSKGFIGYSDYDYQIPMLRYFGKGKALIESVKMSVKQKEEPFRIRGFHASDESWNHDLEMAEKTLGTFTVPIDEPTVKLFEAYLDNCQKNGIKVVLVNAPEYIEGQDFIANREVIMAMYRNYSKKYNIPFLDYATDPISKNRVFFYNALHMNKIGATYFTRQFINDFKKLNLQY